MFLAESHVFPWYHKTTSVENLYKNLFNFNFNF